MGSYPRGFTREPAFGGHNFSPRRGFSSLPLARAVPRSRGLLFFLFPPSLSLSLTMGRGVYRVYMKFARRFLAPTPFALNSNGPR